MYAMAAYRFSRHDSTGYTPNFIVVGRETRTPVDIVYGVRQDEEESTYDGYVSAMKERLLDAYADTYESRLNRLRRRKNDTMSYESNR